MGWHYAARKVKDIFSGETYYEVVEVYPEIDSHTEYAVSITAESRKELAKWLKRAAKDVLKYDVIKDK